MDNNIYPIIYDFFRRRIISRRLTRLLDSMSFKGDGIALDIGGGTGFLLDLISDKIEKYMLLDISREFLEFAERRGISTCRGDVHFLPIRDGSIDVIFSINSLHHLDNPSIAIKEMRRVLKKEGKIFILDFNKNTRIGGFMSIYERILSHNVRLLTMEEASIIFSKAGLKGEFRAISKSSFLYIGGKT